MASNIKLKNIEQTELSIEHTDGQPARSIATRDIPYTVDTVTDMEALIVGTASKYDEHVCFVRDLDRGGSFVFYEAEIVNDNQGTNFSGWVRQYSGAVSVKWFGGDIQLALDSHDDIFIPKDDTYNQSTQLNKVGDVRITSDGAVITDTGISDTALLTLGGSTPTQISSLSVDTAIGDKSLTFASTQDVSDGDIILILNPTDSSWNSSRVDYRAGEMVKVSHVVGNVVYLYDNIVDEYITTEVEIYKMNNAKVDISGFTVIANQTSTISKAIALQYATDSSVTNIKTSLARHMSLGITSCYNTTITGCVLENDKLFGASGLNYGLGVSNSHIVHVSSTYMYGVRHGFTSGGGASFAIPCRYINVNCCTVKSDALQSLDMHGNAEFFNFSNNQVENGIVIGGDNHVVSNNIITGTNLNGGIILFAEAIGFNSSIINNTVNAIGIIDARGNFIDAQDFSKISRDSHVLISGNKVEFDDVGANGVSTNAIYFYKTLGSASAFKFKATIKDNIIKSSTTQISATKAIYIRNTDTANAIAEVNISNNVLDRVGVRMDGIITVVNTNNNMINSPSISGVHCSGMTSDTITISGNKVIGSDRGGFLVSGLIDVSSISKVSITNNEVFDGNITTSGASSTNSNLFVTNATQVKHFGNFMGSPGSAQQRDYYVGAVTDFYVGSNILVTGSVATVANTATTTTII